VTAPTFLGARSVPDAASLERAAEVLNAGAKVAMLVGVGALDAREEVLATARTLIKDQVDKLRS
jgi:thiamine pyrophosphate-dependent acetolactate synthase large subunit-like protein